MGGSPSKVKPVPPPEKREYDMVRRKSYHPKAGTTKEVVVTESTKSRERTLSTASTLASQKDLDERKKTWKPLIVPAHYQDEKEIDGRLWGELLRAGLTALLKNKDHVNRINVFPVPDSDTGTNMFLGLRGGFRDYAANPEEHLGDMLVTFANAMLMSAQGNSGTCLSFLFSGIQKGIGTKPESVTVTKFVKVLKDVGSRMFEAMENAKPGTLITVIKYSAEHISDDVKSIGEMMKQWVDHAKEELERTPDQLIVNGVAVLKKNGVVDSGAQGFVYIIEGMLLALTDEDFEFIDYDAKNAKDVHNYEAMFEDRGDIADHANVDLTYRFCTEVMMTLKDGATADQVKNAVKHLGNSMATVDTSTLMKLHMHSNNPEEVFKRMRPFSKYKGKLDKQKAEDMKFQVKDAEYAVPDMKQAKCGIVWCGASSIPTYLEPLAQHSMVPLRLVLDDEVYDGRVDMTEVHAANIVRIGEYDDASTSCPAIPMFARKVTAFLDMPNIEEVLLMIPPITISKGSVANAHKMMDYVGPEVSSKVTIYEHPYAFAFGGDQVALAFELAAKGLGAKEIVSKIENIYNTRKVFYATGCKTIKTLLKSGRVPVTGKNKIVVPIALKLGLGMTANLPWPYSEANKFKELVMRQKEENRIGKLTAPQKSGVKFSWKGIMKGHQKTCKKKIKPGTRVDCLLETSECQHLVQPLLDWVCETYDVRFVSYAKLPPTTIFTLGFPAVCLFMREVQDGDIALGGQS